MFLRSSITFLRGGGALRFSGGGITLFSAYRGAPIQKQTTMVEGGGISHVQCLE